MTKDKDKKIDLPIDMVIKHIENNRAKVRKGVGLQERTIKEIETIQRELGKENEQHSISQIIDQAVHVYFVIFNSVKEKKAGND